MDDRAHDPTLDPAYRDLAAELALLGRRAVAAGLAAGSGGNLSARLPGRDECLLTAAATWLEDLRAGDFSVVGLDGTLRAGRPGPSSEAALHLHAYRARSDVNAVVHLHPPHATLLDTLGHDVRLLTLDQAFYVRRIARVGYHPPGTAALAEAAAAALADADVVMLTSHGCAVVGGSVSTAGRRAIYLEEAAVATYRALLLGDTTTAAPPEYLERVRALEGASPGLDRH